MTNDHRKWWVLAGSTLLYIALWGRREPIQPPSGRKEGKSIPNSIVVVGFENRDGAVVMPRDAHKGQEVYPNR